MLLHRLLSLLLLASVPPVGALCQMVNPVHSSAAMGPVRGGEADVVFQLRLDAGWHVYSTALGDEGPIEAAFVADQMSGVAPQGPLRGVGNEKAAFDEMFGMRVRYFEDTATFVQRVRFEGGPWQMECHLQYGVCNAESCLPPRRCDYRGSGQVDLAADTLAAEQPLGEPASLRPRGQVADDSFPPDTWRSVVAQLRELDRTAPTRETPGWLIFLQGLLGGLLALLTPCVWPIIPLTVSVFLKRGGSRGRAVADALAYGACIVVLFMALALVVTLLWGPAALNALATNALFNVALCLLLVLFAASFLGAFEITLPAAWTNAVDSRRKGAAGFAAIFLMALTLVLVSFSCTGPIIGFLLVAVSQQGSLAGPAIGIFGFALALALPFALFALFPTLMRKAPKSGAWLADVKVVLGFVELAFALKFLSVADLAYGWGILDREVFLAVWIVLFTLLGAYFLGWLHFRHEDDEEDVAPHSATVVGFFAGVASLSFAVYMLPGLWGAPLKAISAFAPPLSTQDFRLQTVSVEPAYHDFDQAVEANQGRPLLLDFTGYGCVNCRKMEAAVWTDPEVADLINESFTLVSLYVDDKTPLAEPLEVSGDSARQTLRTVGEKWSYLQTHKFGANAQPFYVVVDAGGAPLSPPRGYDEDAQAYLQWLRQALAKANAEQKLNCNDALHPDSAAVDQSKTEAPAELP